ncbi:MAG: SagB/ThcOx family dehydrogenase [Nitrospirota bacterium]
MTFIRWQDLAFSAGSETSLWELFHENSKLGRHAPGLTEKEVREYVASLPESLQFDGYPTVALPKRLPTLRLSVREAIQGRISRREFIKVSMPLNYLAALLLLGYGIVDFTPAHAGESPIRRRRVVPSAGALYPLEIFFHATRVRGLATGLYHFNPSHRVVELVRSGDQTKTFKKSFVQMPAVTKASLVIFITAMFERSTFKYGDRGYRFILLEAGHVAQNINLVAGSLGFGSVNLGGFFEREVDDFLAIDGITHSTIYTLAIGTVKSQRDSNINLGLRRVSHVANTRTTYGPNK